jgi:hypothetical protein
VVYGADFHLWKDAMAWTWMAWTSIREWSQKRTLRAMLKDPLSGQGVPVNGAA